MSKNWIVHDLEVQLKSVYGDLRIETNRADNLVELNHQLKRALRELSSQNKRYREALEFYSDEETYEEIKYEAVYLGGVPIEPPSGEPPLIYYDKGKAARKALEGEE